MIQEFSVQNFLSFKEKQTISFVATKDKTLLNDLTVEQKTGLRLLRMVMIYGANASGKSNLLQAINSVWLLLFTPKNKENEDIEIFQPFALTRNQPAKFEITFWANNRRYQYEVEYNKKSILYEKMMYSSDKGILSLMYERELGKTIKFGDIGIKAKQRDDLNKETLDNHTVISTLNKKNITVPEVLKELYEWIKANVHDIGSNNDGREIAEQALNNPKLKELIIELLCKADFNISDFSLMEVYPPEEIIDRVRNNTSLSNSDKELILSPQKQILFTHETIDDKFQISFGLQSSGTKVYFRLARLLFDIKNDGFILMEDELEDSLHYDLLIHFLQTYLQTVSKSQLIFTTHNHSLLDEDWMIRRDMIWFVEKDNKTSVSTLYRASDMGIHKNASLMNAYQIGKLGAKPLLGSTLLNSDNL